MTAKKVYVVRVEFEMFVLAKNRLEAEAIATDHAREELLNNPMLADTNARLADPKLYASEDTIPWGDANDKTVAELLAEHAERERIERDQLKMPLEVKHGS